MARRSRRYVEPQPRAGSVLQAAGRSSARRRAGPRAPRVGGGGGGGPGGLAPLIVGLVLLGVLVVGGLALWRSHVDAAGDRAAAARRFGSAWAAGDRPAMWRA
ncbi:MAG: hypothetical protein LC720_01615, partial [Actinobacteria bacterium]|nr:hypothetical protein [Actinomycetota bacterium]